ncbi:uncharacterized protein G2W53_033899 [Senna tora]|uniref:Uncharacterized protein n=1 Tax=Senna tora TaxID=362788 RepID=A0A834T050_9FABA|nr:uncharacterized protein G2W53_033899 [Senna tora]
MLDDEGPYLFGTGLEGIPSVCSFRAEISEEMLFEERKVSSVVMSEINLSELSQEISYIVDRI